MQIFDYNPLTKSKTIAAFVLVCGLGFAPINLVAAAPPSDQSNPDESNIRREAVKEIHQGMLYDLSKDFDKSIQCYQKAIALVPGQPKFHFILACAAWNNRDVNLAFEHYSKTIKLNPDFAEAYFGLGLCKEKTNETDAAIAAFKKCSQLKSDFSEAWLHLGQSYELISDDSDAEKAYRKCISSKNKLEMTTNMAKESLARLEGKRR